MRRMAVGRMAVGRMAVGLLVTLCVAATIGATTTALASVRGTGTSSAHVHTVRGPHFYRPAGSYAHSQPTSNRHGLAGLPPNVGSGDLTYWGGPVENNPTAYVIFWGSGWGTQSSLTTDSQILVNFWSHVGHSEYQNLITQYYSTNGGYIANSLNFGGYWVDTSTPPTDSGCSVNSTVEDSSIQSEVNAAIAGNHFPLDHTNATYFVYTPNGTSVGVGNSCSGTQFCAYHTYSGNFGQGFAYASEPYPVSPLGSQYDCLSSSWSVPNGDANADSLANSSSHEWFESATDPFPALCINTQNNQYQGCPGETGWVHINQSGAIFDEIGDECAYVFPTSTGSGGINPSGDTIVNGTPRYYLQTEYSNTSHDCETYYLPKTVGIFRPSAATFYLKNHNIPGVADTGVAYGASSDRPLAGDWTGKGYDSVGIFRPSTASFYLRNSNTPGFPDISVQYGASGDVPVIGDWTGKGYDSIGVYRNGIFYLKNSNTGGLPDIAFAYGAPGDIPIVGDWTGKGSDSVGVYRPSNGMVYLKNTLSAGPADVSFPYGAPNLDTAFSGDWSSLGRDTIGVYRSSTGVFYLRESNTAGNADLVVPFGSSGDLPVRGLWVNPGGGPVRS